jgi:hypothetical protein
VSDTPETDKQAVGVIGWYSCATVPADFARKLERERNEAREAFAIATNNCVDAQKRLREMERERNEAILELGAIQATIAETLNLPRTPLTAADVHAALNHLTQ